MTPLTKAHSHIVSLAILITIQETYFSHIIDGGPEKIKRFMDSFNKYLSPKRGAGLELGPRDMAMTKA